jgi:hypothetical protein
MATNVIVVDEQVYKARNVVPGSYYAKCVEQDLITKIHPTMRQGGYYLSYEGVYKRLAITVGTDTPWHHVNHLRTKKCGLDHSLKFGVFGYVPPRCLECWKVVVSPRTIKELFLLLDVQKGLERPSKCGIEIRHYTPRLYGGYFYNNSLEEGRHRYEEVRKAVDEHISPDVDVILKRACTEYEMALGPSPGWTMTRKQHDLDDRLETLIDTYAPNNRGQTPECLAQVHTHWIEWAWEHRDPTVDEYLGGMPLYPPCVTYHEGDITDVKSDLMKAKAKVKYDIEPEVTEALHNSIRGLAMTKGLTMDKVGAAIGYEEVNPLYVGEGIEIG